jgi:hypothetical protein
MGILTSHTGIHETSNFLLAILIHHFRMFDLGYRVRFLVVSADDSISSLYSSNICIQISESLATTSGMTTPTTTITSRDNTYNLLRAHYTKLDFPNLPDRRGGVWERDRHGGRVQSFSSIVRVLFSISLFSKYPNIL